LSLGLETISLRPDQSRAVDNWAKAGYIGQIVMPTGSGKTIVALAAIKQYSDRTLIVVPTRELIAQWRKMIRRVLGEYAGEYSGDVIEGLGARRVVSTYSSAHRVLEDDGSFDMIVFDECHHLNAPTWGRLLELSAGRKVMGLTATPEDIPRLPVVFSMDVDEAIEIGAVSRVMHRRVWVPLNPLYRPNVSVIMSRIDRLRALIGHMRDGPEKTEILRMLACLWQSLRIILELTPEKKEAVLKILNEDKPDKSIIFVETIEGTRELAKLLRLNGYTALEYHSALRMDQRKAILERLRQGNAIIVAAKALDEGIDIPTVKHIIILSCPKKLRRLVQRMGRGMRPGQPLKLYTISTTINETQQPTQTYS